MKSFKAFLDECGTPVVSTQPMIADELNRMLVQITSSGFPTPHAALDCVSKTLAPYGISLPRIESLPESKGEEIFEVQQSGNHGHDFVYFTWELNESGIYEAFALVLDEESLTKILGESFEGDDESSFWKKRNKVSIKKKDSKPTKAYKPTFAKNTDTSKWGDKWADMHKSGG